MGMKQKKKNLIFFFKMADTKKTEIFKTTDSQKNFGKITRIGPWVSRIDWCKGHLSFFESAILNYFLQKMVSSKFLVCLYFCNWVYLSFYATTIFMKYHIRDWIRAEINNTEIVFEQLPLITYLFSLFYPKVKYFLLAWSKYTGPKWP